VRRLSLLVTLAAFACLAPPAAAQAPPPPCGGVPQISDPRGDGHHTNTDVLAGWVSEQAGRLQAVIQLQAASWESAHEATDTVGFAFLFANGGLVRYVRAEARRGTPVVYDFGTWTRAGGFASAGGTAGVAVAGPSGTVTIDVPAATGAAAGAVLARPFVLTYDGGSGADRHWVDGAPGGELPEQTTFGADYVVGSCVGGQPGGGGGGAGGGITSVALKAPRRLRGGGRALLSGRVLPARAGVTVAISARGRRTVRRRVTTAADGTYATSMRISETSRVRAVAEGIGSETRTVRVFSRVRIKIRRLRGGGALVMGRVRPALPGRVLWLRNTAAKPSARTKARRGRFRIRMERPRKGRYQAVFIPSGRRAERSTSNTGVIR
jgi:hypothetical protein